MPATAQHHHAGMGRAMGTRTHAQIQAAMLVDHVGFRNMFGTMVPAARQVLSYIVNKRNWIPLRPEVPVYDETMGVCARFDIVAAKPDGTLIFIEVKTGSKHCFESTGADMEGPLRGVLRDSDLNRALVQLAASVMIALRAHRKIQAFEAYVFHAQDDNHASVRVYPMPRDLLLKMGSAIYRAMHTACAKKGLH